jgi:uncharacterized protein
MIINDLISVLDVDTEASDIRQGVFHTGVLTRHCGLAATLARDAFKQKPPMVKEAGFLLDKPVSELIRLALSDGQLEAAVGMATVNSLIEINDNACLELNAASLILKEGAGKKIAIVGHFPFVPRIAKAAKKLWVIDKNPEAGDFSYTDADQLIPMADVVAITGSAFSNHTIEHLLACCRPGAYVVVLGDTTPLSPVLFDYGVDAVCGTQVVDADLALRCVSQGANFRQIKGTRRLTMMRDG